MRTAQSLLFTYQLFLIEFSVLVTQKGSAVTGRSANIEPMIILIDLYFTLAPSRYLTI
jgi:hypothetical protein